MPLPDDGVAAISRWVAALNAEMPPHVATQLRYETDVYPNAVTLVECRAVDHDKPDGDWFRMPFARLRFFRSSGWELFWADRNSDFHVYEFTAPTLDVVVTLSGVSSPPVHARGARRAGSAENVWWRML